MGGVDPVGEPREAPERSAEVRSREEPQHGRGCASQRATRIIILEHNPCARDGLCAVLATYPDIEVVAAVADDSQAIALTQRLRPDALVLDAGRAGVRGIGVVRQVRSEPSGPRVVVLSFCSSHRGAALRAGADTFLLKGCLVEDLVAAILG